jgi:hypothetical protein
VDFGIDRRARSRKTGGLFRRAPDPHDAGERLGKLVRRMEKAAVVRSGRKRERFVVELALHPAAPAATLAIDGDGELVLRAETSTIGPGYHADVLARIAPILDELDYAWVDDVDVAAVPDAMAAWLAGELRAGVTRFGLDRAFHVDAAVLTALGPRDAAWRDAVIAEPRRGADAFAWWESGPGRAAWSRAMLAMWHEVPWREPLDDAERAVMNRIDAELRAARRADPALVMPWPEWAELLDLLGRDDEHATEVHSHVGGRPPTIGYRRHDLDVELSGGWTVRLGGAFVGRWEGDGERYWATDGDRAIEFTSLTANDEGDSDRLLEVAPERHPVIARLSDGALRGRAEAYDDDDVHVVQGLVTCAPHVAILTCKGTAADEAWALATWRSLRQG